MRYVVQGLAQCQRPSGWLAAFPESFLDRVEALQPVWACAAPPHSLLARRAPLDRRRRRPCCARRAPPGPVVCAPWRRQGPS
eukprot:597284-Prymnesium_polylepis.1